MGDGYLVMGGFALWRSFANWMSGGRRLVVSLEGGRSCWRVELGGSLEEGGGGSLEEAQLDSLLLPSTYCVWTGFTYFNFNQF